VSKIERIPARAVRRARGKRPERFEALEPRRLLAAHIVGNPTSYATIQAAVDAAVAGATITVDPGVYAEGVAIFKPLTLRGAQAGVDGRSNARGVSESIVTGVDTGAGISLAFKIGVDNVVLDGFTVQGQSTQSSTTGAGIVINPSVSGTHIVNNIVQNNATGMFIANSSTTNPLVIEHNTFRLNNNAGPSSGAAILTNGSLSGGNITNVSINENYFFKNFGTSNLEAAI
jgi:hypothetical protein